MSTITPIPFFKLGNVAQFTKFNSNADDTNLFALGNILSYLDYGVAIPTGNSGGFGVSISSNVFSRFRPRLPFEVKKRFWGDRLKR